MDFAGLKRRSTDLFNSLPQNMPSMPSMPHFPHMPHMPQLPSMPRMGGKGGKAAPPTMKGTWQHISVPSFPRSSHSLDIVAGTAYLFGGEVTPGETLDNDMHILTLPSSGAPADYYAIKAKPAPKSLTETPGPISEEDETAAQLKDPLTDVPLSSPRLEPSSATTDKGKNVELLPGVPSARLGHTTAVIGSRIFLFGGRSSAEDSDTLNEGGRVWVFETKTHAWSYLDPYRSSPIPPARSYSTAVATEKPRDFAIKPLRRTATWTQWAEGDSAEVGIPQRPIPGSIAARATDDEDAGFGTFIIHGGVLADGSRTSDIWAFDVRSCTWKELPAAPGPARSGAALALAKSRLYRYGGFDGEQELGGQLDVLQLVLDEFDDRVSKGEIGIFARGEWETLLPPVAAEAPHPHSHEKEHKPTTEAQPVDQEKQEKESEAEPVPADETVNETARLVETESWPSHRSASTMELVLGGGGREYLVLMFGESSPSTFHSDVWTYQVPPEGMTAASVTDAVLHAVGRRSGEGLWTRVTAGPYDDEVDLDVVGPPARARAAAAPLGDLEENAILVFGGLGENERRLGDAWVFRLG